MNDLPLPTPGTTARYRIAPIADRHVANSARAILAAAAQTGTRRVVVLGAGKCEEIPLRELAERFDKVVLVDLYAEALEQALAAPGLSDAARAKFEVRIADLTGLADEMERRWRAALDGTPDSGAIEPKAADSAAAIERIAAIADGALNDTADDARPAQPAGQSTASGRRLLDALGGEPFDLVVASCLLSQLHTPLYRRAAQVFLERFGSGGSILRAAPRWQTSLQQMSRRIEADFISQLPALVAPGGRIYLSESVQVCFIETASDGAWTSTGSYRMTKSVDLTDYLAGLFQIEAGARWTWVAALPQPGQPGRLFDVQALTLKFPEAGESSAVSG